MLKNCVSHWLLFHWAINNPVPWCCKRYNTKWETCERAWSRLFQKALDDFLVTARMYGKVMFSYCLSLCVHLSKCVSVCVSVCVCESVCVSVCLAYNFLMPGHRNFILVWWYILTISRPSLSIKVMVKVTFVKWVLDCWTPNPFPMINLW